MEEEYVKLNKAFRKKKQTPHIIKDEKTTQLNIQPRFQRNTRNIMKISEPETADKTQIDCKLKKQFQQISKQLRR